MAENPASDSTTDCVARMKQQLPVICLMGPTAVGKSDIAMQLTEHVKLDLISVDSAMIYRGMNIGTAKPDSTTLATYPHQLIDICDASERYSAAQFCQDAITAIDASHAQQRIPLLVGGTMLYFHALQQGLATLPAANPVLRQQLSAQAAAEGWQALHAQLTVVDPIAAAKIKPTDTQRLQRALEVYQLTGVPLSTLQKDTSRLAHYQFHNLAIIPQQRDALHQRIAERFGQMLTQGFLDEAKTFYQRGDLTLDNPSMRCVGYRQAWLYFAAALDYQQMCEKAVIATRQLAKRQLTWLRRWQGLTSFTMETQSVLPDIYNYLQKQNLDFA